MLGLWKNLMKIKKISGELVYKKEAYNYVVEVNGKPVRIGTYQEEDNEFNQYDDDQTINEADIKTLTDIEHEALGENLSEILDLKVGEATTI